MKRFVIFPALLLIVFTVTACSENESPNGPNNDPLVLIPLKVGNWWAMRTVVSREGIPFYESIDTSRIDTSFTWGGAVWYGNSASNYFQRNGTEGLLTLYLYPSGDSGRTELTYKFPAIKDDSWMTQPDSIAYLVLSTNESVTVPTATYSQCIEYYYIVRPTGESGNVFFKPGVGNVLSESYFDFAGVQTRAKIEMIAYHLQ